MAYQIVMTDLDGTLLNDNHEIGPENSQALKALMAKGVRIVFSSGRMYKAIRRITKGFDDGAVIAACNGGYIIDQKSGLLLSESVFDFHTSLAVIDVLEKRGLSHHFYTGDAVYARHGENATRYRSMQGFLDELKISLIAHSPLGAFIHEGVKPHKFGVILDAQTDVVELKNALNGIEGISVYTSAQTLLDVMPVGVHKGTALETIARHLGVEPNDIIACGDQENDIEMIKRAGVGIAMHQSVDALVKVADRHLKSEEAHVMQVILADYF